jgi:hypothetical protein
MKMHEGQGDESNRMKIAEASSSSDRHHSFTTDSCSPASSSFENQTPMKLSSSSSAHYTPSVIDGYQPDPNAAFTSHYYHRATGLNF